ncbi:MAG: amino acid carrier protein [Bacteroidota bacterium]
MNAVLTKIENTLWGYGALPLIIVLGTWFSVWLKFPQISKLPPAIRSFVQSMFEEEQTGAPKRGISPLKAFFTSIGGCIGIANLVTVCSAIKVGGPGAVFWMWVAAFLGMVIKYSEVYLGIKFRVKNSTGSYDGGPMFYLQKLFDNQAIPVLFALLLAFYGTEIYLFSLIVDTVEVNWGTNKYMTIFLLLGLVLYAVRGGVERVGKISSFMVPLFMTIYLSMCVWILYQNSAQILPTFKLILQSAFTGHAAVGGFTGSTVLLSMSQGMARGCYSGDIGIGYAAIVHAESSHADPENQPNLSILGIYLDTFLICTFTTLIVLVTNMWSQECTASMMTQMTLSQYFPYMSLFMPLFLFIVGYSTIIAYFVVGLKCVKFLSPKWGTKIYYMYGIISFCLFSFVDADIVIKVMAICNALLLFCNVYGIYKLREELPR